MQNPSVLRKHAALLDHMADRLGVDLEEATMRGELRISELTDAVLSCTACADPTACQHWLDTPAENAGDAPGYCRNSALLGQLQDKLSA